MPINNDINNSAYDFNVTTGPYKMLGAQALYYDPVFINTFIGASGNLSNTGGENVAIGFNSLIAMGAGATGNLAIGTASLQGVTASSYNIAIGSSALASYNDMGGGTANVAIGNSSALFVSDADQSVFIGADCAIHASFTNQSVFIGNQISTTTGSSMTPLEDNIAIGYGATIGAAVSNCIVIGAAASSSTANSLNLGNASTTSCIIKGITGVTVSNTELVTINSSTGQLGVTPVPAAAFSWQLSTSGTTLVKSTGYIVTSGANSYALPSTASSTVGDTIQLVLSGGTSWTVTEASSQQIRLGNTTTTATTGTLVSTAQGDWIELVYQATGLWVGNVKQGNITVT